MNHAKIAAALHALAEAFEGALEEVVPAKGKGKKAAAPDLSASPQANQLSPNTQFAGPASNAPAEPVKTLEPYVAPAPVVTIDKAKLNAAVLKVAAKSRDAAEAILAKFGAKNTVTLPPEQWQAVYDAFEEEIAKIDAAAVQVAQASLV